MMGKPLPMHGEPVKYPIGAVSPAMKKMMGLPEQHKKDVARRIKALQRFLLSDNLGQFIEDNASPESEPPKILSVADINVGAVYDATHAVGEALQPLTANERILVLSECLANESQDFNAGNDDQWRAKYQQAMETWAEETCQLHAKNDELLNVLKELETGFRDPKVAESFRAAKIRLMKAREAVRAAIAKAEGRAL